MLSQVDIRKHQYEQEFRKTSKNDTGSIEQKQKRIRRRGKNTQRNYPKKDLHDPDNHNGMITHLEPDILECQVKWALGTSL